MVFDHLFTHVAQKQDDGVTVTNCTQVFPHQKHICDAHNMNSSSLVLSESDRLPSPHEGDYTNLCKACKWFIVQSTTRGFFSSFFFYNTVDKMRREKARDTETFSNPYTHHHMLFLCHCQQEWSNKTWWNFGIFFYIIKLRVCFQGIFSH